MPIDCLIAYVVVAYIIVAYIVDSFVKSLIRYASRLRFQIQLRSFDSFFLPGRDIESGASFGKATIKKDVYSTRRYFIALSLACKNLRSFRLNNLGLLVRDLVILRCRNQQIQHRYRISNCCSEIAVLSETHRSRQKIPTDESDSVAIKDFEHVFRFQES